MAEIFKVEVFIKAYSYSSTNVLVILVIASSSDKADPVKIGRVFK